MEVQHPQHPTHKKKWSEYIIEFVMLFTAVTLGFFAENLREHTIIKERLAQNKIAILKDLKQDAITIDSILVQNELLIQRFNSALNVLYLSKKGGITESELLSKVIPTLIAGNPTLYVNNSSFKNMQSSGLLSNLEDNELKSKLSYYYEVVFKRIESNNNSFDQSSINYNNTFPMGVGADLRRTNQFNNEYPLNNSKNYFDFMLSLKKTKEILKSDDFIYNLQKYYNFIFIYKQLITMAKVENKKLTELMEASN
jgi:hypothetical protein